MKHKLLMTAAALALPGTALADEAAGENEPTILVTGESEGYVTIDSATATKTDTPLIDVPQTINAVTREQIEDQAHRSLADVLRYVPGVTIGQGEGNRDQITLRGQNTTADFFLDGVRDDVQYFRNLYNIQRVEVLKGPYALIFGRGGGGGIVNRVQKTPSAERMFVAGEASINTFGAWTASTDVNMPVAEGAAFRLNAFYEELDSNRDFYEGDRYAVNPYVAFEFAPGWKAGLSYEYVHDDRVTDRGVPALACAQPCTPGPLPGHRDTFFGVPGVNRTGIEAHIVKARLDGELTERLNWSTTVLYGDYDKYYTNVYANSAATAVDGTVSLRGYTDPTTRENFIAQTNLVADVNLGGIANQILLGLEYGDQDSTNQRRNAELSSDTLDLSNIVYPTVTFPALSRNRASNVEFLSAYAQDQISFGDHVDLVVGIRYDRFEINGTDFQDNNRVFGRTDEKWSPRVGLIVKPRENISIYGSYSQSFQPRSGDQFLSLSTSDEDLAPEKFTNYEVGAKWNIRPDLNLTVAAFQLDQTNATTPNPADPATSIVAGKTRTRGVELALAGQVLPGWQVSGGYTYQDAKLRGNDFVRLGQVPEHQFALWNRYDFNRSVGVGLGIVHQSSQFAANRTSATTTRLPGFTRIDAAMFYTVNEALELQINVENALDETYFAAAHNNNNITPGAPINARFTARVKF
ncbi:TonB-dependent receptor [Novosphingobium malaysiense]|uniref:TonB-dependent receptor n=1 Tax=Novosphingobium malaysiense TaxID=1348853 RepID=A0A0B1ZVB2_9SPHN|nr:TonB-dependent siderophore receptor [Novosphingobium malaysiense]KHK93062.1 TonB-dependent receptor [Novosphingobium malaysiense]